MIGRKLAKASIKFFSQMFVQILAYYGLRWGEASGLRVKDIDFKRGRLEGQHTIVEVDSVKLDSQPKDFEARSIPVPASLLAELKEHVEGKEAGTPVFAAARGGWLRGRGFRHGEFDEATELIRHDAARHIAARLRSARSDVETICLKNTPGDISAC